MIGPAAQIAPASANCQAVKDKKPMRAYRVELKAPNHKHQIANNVEISNPNTSKRSHDCFDHSDFGFGTCLRFGG